MHDQLRKEIMNNKGTRHYVDKVKEIRNKTDMMEGCKNRMRITDDRDELLNLYASLTLYAAELYHYTEISAKG